MENHASDQEDIEFFSKEGEFLQEFYELKDFLSCPKTNKTLEKYHYETYQSFMEPKIIDFFNNVYSYEQNYGSGLLQQKNKGAALGELVSLIYNNLDKEFTYDLSIFYKNPELASCLLEEEKSKNKINDKVNKEK